MLVLIEENKEEVIKMLKVIKVIYFGEICLVRQLALSSNLEDSSCCLVFFQE